MPPQRLLTIVLLATSIGLELPGDSVQGARQRSDFSGEWVLNLANSRLHEDYSVLERRVVPIEHREPTFTFRRVFTVKGRPSETSYSVTIDGKEHRAIAYSGAGSSGALRSPDKRKGEMARECLGRTPRRRQTTCPPLLVSSRLAASAR